MKILMVCLGNICRSPLAEGIMRVKMDEMQIEGFVDSAGISDYHAGDPPDQRAINVADEFGVDISRQVSRPFAEADLETFDYIFTMDKQVHGWIKSKMSKAHGIEKVHLFLDFCGSGKQTDVPDPYYGGVLEFREVFGILEKGCQNALNKMIRMSNG
jgi:protein-tyrosine phosphatase